MHLHAAAARGDLEGIAYAIKRGTPVDAADRWENTALAWALQMAGRAQEATPKLTIPALRMLLDAGASVEKHDGVDSLPLFHAAQIPDEAFLDELLARGADPRKVSKSKYTAATYAAHQAPGPAKIAMLAKLRGLGVDMDQESSHGETPASVCYRRGDFVTLQHLLKMRVSPAPLYWTPLHHAVAFGTYEDVKPLAVSAAGINERNRRFEISPWLLAVQVGDPAKLQLLAERGADLAQPARLGDSALHLAAAAGAAASVRWLLDYGADIHAACDFGDTPLHAAVKAGRADVVKMLLAAGADPARENSVQEKAVNSAVSAETVRLLIERDDSHANAISGCGEWPLKEAAAVNDAALVAWLLKKGAKVDLTSTGDTALHAAVGADARECVELLLAAGADVNAQDVDGWTPLFFVRSREMISRLKSAGANSSVGDPSGFGPAHAVDDPLLIEMLTGRRAE